MPPMGQNLDAFISKWAGSGAAERANKDLFLAELCAVLDVEPPNPSTGDPQRDVYVFEREAKLAHEGGEATIGRIDLYKHGCFILEAKQASGEGTSRLGKAKRGTPAWNILMKDAYGQALGYARSFDRPPPFIVVCDIGHCFDLYAAFDGSGNYQPFPNAQNNRLFLCDMGQHRDTLRGLFDNPLDLDPSKHAAKITHEVAGHLANLAQEAGRADRGRARPAHQGRGRVDRGRGRRRLQGRQEVRRRRGPRQPGRPRHPGHLRCPRHPPLEIHPHVGVAHSAPATA
jgi:hypothetical protein